MAFNPTSARVWCYSATILTSSFLMFLIEPMVGKIITPQYGGVAAVWALCLLFFQAVLLGGYGLSYGLCKAPPKIQGVCYMLLFLAAVVLIKIPLGAAWAPSNPAEPITSLLGMLVLYLAFPMILMSTVSVMIQYWYRLSGLGEPYHLYSLSNIGSLGALFTYPFLIEPTLTLSRSVHLWEMGFGVLVALTSLSAVALLTCNEHTTESVESEDESGVTPNLFYIAGWVGLSALGTMALVSYTNFLTNEIASIPLVWLIPLGLYLLTFILVFSKKRFYLREWFFLPLQLLILLFLVYRMHLGFVPFLLMLFGLCMVCHGEIVLHKPKAKYLPGFYLAISFGGVLGGAFINLAAPLIFKSLLADVLMVNCMVAGITIFIAFREQTRPFLMTLPNWLSRATTVCYIGALLLLIYCSQRVDQLNTVYEERNFYSAVRETKETVPHFNKPLLVRRLYHGNVRHGGQVISADPAERSITVSYYSPHSAIGIIDHYLRQTRPNQPLQIGVIGLGVGSTLPYAQKGDQVTYYEIDPKIERIARTHYTNFQDSPAQVNVIIGDGRLTLEREPDSKQYDILMVDAFNGHAIPVHMLTRESMRTYFKHLKPNGVLLFHITNQHIDLAPLIGNLTGETGARGYLVESQAHPQDGLSDSCRYAVITREAWLDPYLLSDRVHRDHPRVQVAALPTDPKLQIWTDDFSNLLSVLKRPRTNRH